MEDCGCQLHFSKIRNGSASNRSCPNCAVAVVPGLITARSSKVSSGFSRPVPAGEICHRYTLPRAPVGGGCGSGRNRMCGCESGGRSCANSTGASNWTGVRVFWTGVSLPPKRGRRRRQNQARQGHEVDGGGRRPGCSSGKPAGHGQSGGSDPGRIDAGHHRGAPPRTRPAAKASAAPHRRPGLRQRSVAPAVAAPRHPLDLLRTEEAAPNQPRRTGAICAATASAGRSNAPLPGWATSAAWSCATKHLLMYQAFFHVACLLITLRYL